MKTRRMKTMGKFQRDILDTLRSLKGVKPTTRELAAELGVRYRTLCDAIRRLAKKRLVRRWGGNFREKKAWRISITDLGVEELELREQLGYHPGVALTRSRSGTRCLAVPFQKGRWPDRRKLPEVENRPLFQPGK